MAPSQAGQSLPDEKAFIERARQGDKDAYRYLVEGYQDRVYRMVFSMVNRAQQADDLTQEVFVKAFFALPSFKGDSAFYTWLFRITSNHCLDHLRKRRPIEISIDQPVHEENERTVADELEAPENEKPGAALEKAGELVHLLQMLDPNQRMLLTLRELEGYSYEQLATTLKCSVNTIKSRLNRARNALKTVFKTYGKRNIYDPIIVSQGGAKP